MTPGSPEASLEGNPAETSNSATTHTTADVSANSSTAITNNTSSSSTAATTVVVVLVVVALVVLLQLLLLQLAVVLVVDRLPQEAQAYYKEVRGMLQEDLLVLREHQTFYWLLQKWKSALMRGHRGGKRKEGSKMQN